MNSVGTPSPGQPETVAELRSLYRSAEARAARLRLLIDAGRELSTADAQRLSELLRASARRAAHFAGYRDGEITTDTHGDGFPLIAPGPEERRVGTLRLTGEGDLAAIAGTEDGEALSLLAQLIAAAMDRAARDGERERLLAALKERERRLEQVVERLFTAQEDERRYVSRELHDGVAQTATALFRRLDALPGDRDETTELASIAQGLVRELRGVIAGLRPMTLDDLGLAPAIATLADDLGKDGYDVALEAAGSDDWPDYLATAYFRIAQEAISNIRKHAGDPCRVEIRLEGDGERRRWELYIRDHGTGMKGVAPDRALPGQHVGIEMMRERMSAVGGTLDVTAHGADGVCVRAVVVSPA